jgi:uncharacterized protein HemY
VSHEVSETVQDKKTGKWVNVYGRKTSKAGQRLPQDATDFGHGEYDTVEQATSEAKQRSEMHRGGSLGAARKALLGQ